MDIIHSEKIHFATNVVGAAADTLNIPVPFSLEDFRNSQFGNGHLGLLATAVEGYLVVDTATGAGGTPTLDVKLQSSPDGFATANLITDVLTFTQVTAAASELKSARQAYGGSPIQFGKDFRLNIVADTASGDKVFSGYIVLVFKQD